MVVSLLASARRGGRARAEMAGIPTQGGVVSGGGGVNRQRCGGGRLLAELPTLGAGFPERLTVLGKSFIYGERSKP